MRRLAKLGLLTSALSLSCGHNHDDSVRVEAPAPWSPAKLPGCRRTIVTDVDSTFSPSSLEALAFAAEAWKESTGNRVCFSLFLGGLRPELTILRASGRETFRDKYHRTDWERVLGIYSPVDSTIEVLETPMYTDSRRAQLFAHELGHFLGLEHVTIGPTVMTPGLWDGDPVTSLILPRLDVAQFCRVNGCLP